jgi:signal transduction histidine kinase
MLQLFLVHWRGTLFGVALIAIGTMVVWREYVSWPQRVAWSAVVLGGLAVQAIASLRLERFSLKGEVARRWLPWMHASIFIVGCAWGSVPWLLASAPISTQLLAAFFNVLLIFSVVNAPATTAMMFSAWAPTTLLTAGAFMNRPGLWIVDAILLALFMATLLYGIRMQRAMATNLWERDRAADLAEALKQQQRRLLEVERERALLLERERLMRDMHDGLGSALVSSLAAAERGVLTTEDMAGTLRECVDDLRIVIDSLDPNNYDLVGLLAALRFRLGRRLEIAGIEVDWHVDELPPLAWMGASESLQLMRAIQEILSNVVKHAHARRVSVTAQEIGAGVEVTIKDDGCGFDPDLSAMGRGLRSLRQRADALHGRLSLNTQLGAGTAVRLWLPFDIPMLRKTGDNITPPLAPRDRHDPA